MSLAKYNALLKVMENNSITKAAKEIGYTQSGISYMIKTLENEVGFSLLIRNKDGVVPTENALKLKPILKKLIATNRDLTNAIYEIAHSGQESIKIGSYNSMLLNWVPQILKRFFVKFPDADVNLVEGSDAELESMLEHGDVDIAFTAGAEPEGYKFLQLAEDPFLVMLPKEHPLAKKSALTIDDISGCNLVLPNENYYKDLTDSLNSKNSSSNGEHSTYSLKDSSSIMSMVANNLAISILPQRSVPVIPATIVARPFADGYFRKLGITYPDKKRLPPAIWEFISTAQDVVRDKKL